MDAVQSLRLSTKAVHNSVDKGRSCIQFAGRRRRFIGLISFSPRRRAGNPILVWRAKGLETRRWRNKVGAFSPILMWFLNFCLQGTHFPMDGCGRIGWAHHLARHAHDARGLGVRQTRTPLRYLGRSPERNAAKRTASQSCTRNDCDIQVRQSDAIAPVGDRSVATHESACRRGHAQLGRKPARRILGALGA